MKTELRVEERWLSHQQCDFGTLLIPLSLSFPLREVGVLPDGGSAYLLGVSQGPAEVMFVQDCCTLRGVSCCWL